MNAFDPHAPEIMFFQYDNNTYVFSSLYSDLFAAYNCFEEHAVVSIL